MTDFNIDLRQTCYVFGVIDIIVGTNKLISSQKILQSDTSLVISEGGLCFSKSLYKEVMYVTFGMS